MLKARFTFLLLLSHVTKQNLCSQLSLRCRAFKWNESIVFTVGDYIFLGISIISTPDYVPYIILSHGVNGIDFEYKFYDAKKLKI